MQPGSDKHSSRQDENIKHDVRPLVQSGREARADGAREQEGPADDEPTSDARLTGGRPAEDDVLDYDEVEARSTLAASLRPSVWPANRETLVACAREENAPGWLIDRLSQLPDGTFTHTEAVWEALGGRVEFRA
ncbi:MAG: DUF2795 domain-containing protein [Actinomycetota bacterium]|nr:DUF2795 domain-containing protein [Actinomycetota bacterium]